MRKLIALALALLLLALPILSLAQDATQTEEGDTAFETAAPDTSTDETTQADGMADESVEAEDVTASSSADEPIRESTDESSEVTVEPLDAAQVADKALELTALIARAVNLGAAPFDGAPDAETAWALTYAALEQGAVKGLESGTVTLEDLNAAYGQIFSEGELPDMPTDFSLLDLEGGVYHQNSDPGDIGYAPYLVNAAGSEALVTAEVAVMAVDSQSPEDLTALIAVTLTPDDASLFGATLSGFSPIIGAPAMTKAEATATLEQYKKITYASENVLDGDYTTCWAYPVEDEGAVITLSSEQPQTTRGIRLTPAYAKSEKLALANNRVKSIHVELSDGAAYDYTVQPDLSGELFERFASFAFDGTHEVTWVSVKVTEVYPGDKYTDTCISEIALFQKIVRSAGAISGAPDASRRRNMPFSIVREDNTNMRVDAIVNAANTRLQMGGGVCGAIFCAAGEAALQEACGLIGSCETGKAVITPGFRLPAKYVIHTPGPVWRGGGYGEEALLRGCYQNSLHLAAENGLASIAFPLISSGIYGYPKREAQSVATATIWDFLDDHDMDVFLTLFGKAALDE